MKRINQAVKYGAGASLMSLAVAANAAIPTGVTDKIEELATDGTTVAWALFLGLLAIVVVKYMRRSL